MEDSRFVRLHQPSCYSTLQVTAALSLVILKWSIQGYTTTITAGTLAMLSWKAQRVWYSQARRSYEWALKQDHHRESCLVPFSHCIRAVPNKKWNICDGSLVWVPDTQVRLHEDIWLYVGVLLCSITVSKNVESILLHRALSLMGRVFLRSWYVSVCFWILVFARWLALWPFDLCTHFHWIQHLPRYPRPRSAGREDWWDLSMGQV